jgi:hypothetical protein
VGCAPDGLAKFFRVLGAYVLRPSLGRHASGGPARLLAAMLGDLGVSTLHTLKIDILSQGSSSTIPGHRNFSYDVINDFFIRRTFQDLAGYPRILGIVDLRPL